MKKALGLSLIFVIMIAVRILIDKSENINYLIGAINWASLIVTAGCILGGEINVMREAYASRPQSIAKNAVKRITIRDSIIFIIINALLMGLYFWLLCSNLANDILSIITIGIAVLDEEIVNFIKFLYGR